ncbi:uncharacterized protein ACBT44_002633 isoform 2-T2 [Syngnathus typhle]
MLNTRSLQKTFLLAAVLVALVQLGHGQGKPTECCKKVSTKEITEEVLGYQVAIPQPPCLPAVIFYTKDSFYCAAIRAPWVRQKVAAINAANALPTRMPSKRSLLPIIASTASAPSSAPPSSSS